MSGLLLSALQWRKIFAGCAIFPGAGKRPRTTEVAEAQRTLISDN
jgi:hypothetical protein